MTGPGVLWPSDLLGLTATRTIRFGTALQRRGGIGLDRRTGAYFATSFDSLKALGQLSSMERASVPLGAYGESEGYTAALLRGLPPLQDGDRHRECRRALRVSIDGFAGVDEAVLTRLCDRLAAADEVDFVADFGAPLAEAFSESLLGPRSGVPYISLTTVASCLLAAGQPSGEMNDHIARQVLREADAALERSSGGTAVSLRRLAAHGVVDKEAAAATLLFLKMAGIETIAGTAALIAAAVSTEAELFEFAKASPGEFVAEVIRLTSPVQLFVSVARNAIQISGREVPSGATVILNYAAANRDIAVFDGPAEIRSGRPRSTAAFGFGRHSCLGASKGVECLERVTVLLCEALGAANHTILRAEFAEGAFMHLPEVLSAQDARRRPTK